jgi:GNAT superfamily N-acetyltransferase
VVDSFYGTSQTVVDSLMAIRELNRKFVLSLLLIWLEMLTPQRRQPTQKQQAPFQRLMSAPIRKTGKGLVLRIYHPKQVRPDAPQNQELEGLVSEVVTHSDKEDLHMRFFGHPDVEGIAARITGRRRDKYEQPRDIVIVAFNNDKPVGYTDIVQDPSGEQTAEIAMLVRSDMQRQGIGEAMVKKAVEETRMKGIRHLKAYLHRANYKMKQALNKWPEDLHIRLRKEWEAGELKYVINL